MISPDLRFKKKDNNDDSSRGFRSERAERHVGALVPPQRTALHCSLQGTPAPRKGSSDASAAASPSEKKRDARQGTNAQTDVLLGGARSAICVQRLDDSLNSAIHTRYRSLLRSSSMHEPRGPPLEVVKEKKICISHTTHDRQTKKGQMEKKKDVPMGRGEVRTRSPTLGPSSARRRPSGHPNENASRRPGREDTVHGGKRQSFRKNSIL